LALSLTRFRQPYPALRSYESTDADSKGSASLSFTARCGVAPMTDQAAQLLTVEDLSLWLQVSRSGIYNLVREDRIPPPVRVGKLMRWDRTDMSRWLEHQKGG